MITQSILRRSGDSERQGKCEDMTTWTLSTPGYSDVEVRIYPTRRAMKKAIGEYEANLPRSPMGYHCVLENDDHDYLPVILLNQVDCLNSAITDVVAHETFHAVMSLFRINRGLMVDVQPVTIDGEEEDDFALLQGGLIKAIRNALKTSP